MLFNIVVGFIIPWILALWLYRYNSKLILLIFPFASMVSFTVNLIAFQIGFWSIIPHHLHALAALPADLGYFALNCCWIIYAIQKTRRNPYIVLIIFCILATLVEGVFVYDKRIVYGQGWNLFYTYFSYLIPYTIVYWYYLILRKKKII